MTQSGVVVGSARYMSPEQARGERLTAASDMFSMGTILYQALTGCYPFDSETLYGLIGRIASDSFIPIAERRLDLPPELVSLLERLHDARPEVRPAATDAARALARIGGISN